MNDNNNYFNDNPLDKLSKFEILYILNDLKYNILHCHDKLCLDFYYAAYFRVADFYIFKYVKD